MDVQKIECILLLSCAFFIIGVSTWQFASSRTKQVTLRSSADCSSAKSLHMVGKNYSEYHIVMQWEPYNCSTSEQGFFCKQTFIQEDNFSNLGTRLCIDVQGVQHTLKEMTQLYVNVEDRMENLKKIYSSTRLLPKDRPYYVCAPMDQNLISVSIQVLPSLLICPAVLPYLFNNKIPLGTVTSRAMNSIAAVDLDQCWGDNIPRDDSYLIKVSAAGAQRECRLMIKLPNLYSYMRGCLKVVHFSKDYDCDVNVWLSPGGNDDDSEISLRLDRSPGSDMQKCATFAARDGVPILFFTVYPRYRSCKGQFALGMDFRQTPPPDSDDDGDDRSPNLYMAVFITLIAICLVCLGLTCLCCVRFRAKRLRRLQRRNHRRQVSVPNQGFQYDMSAAPPYDTDGPWNVPDPGMLFQLPSYDDVVAESSGGINPAAESNKDDLPPAYDSVCSTTDT